jgi:hypothetical protein
LRSEHIDLVGPGPDADVNLLPYNQRRVAPLHDHALNAAEWIVYDALYEYCREMVKRSKPAGQFALKRRPLGNVSAEHRDPR